MSEATVMVHWPGQDSPACDEHAVRLRKLGEFMGFAVSCSLIVSSEPIACKNCENEAKKAASQIAEKP